MNIHKSNFYILVIGIIIVMLSSYLRGDEEKIQIGKLNLFDISENRTYYAPDWPPILNVTLFEVRGVIVVPEGLKSLTINNRSAYLLNFEWDNKKHCYLTDRASFFCPQISLSPLSSKLIFEVTTQKGEIIKKEIDVVRAKRPVRIVITDELTGKEVTPDTIRLDSAEFNLPESLFPYGTYLLEINKEGYSDYKRSTTIPEGDGSFMIYAKLTSLPRKVNLEISGDFSSTEKLTSAFVTFNGRDDKVIKPGNYQLLIRYIGYFDCRESLTIPIGVGPLSVYKRLTSKPRLILTKVSYNSLPSGEAGEKSQISLTPVSIPEGIRNIDDGCSVKPGAYILRIQKTGYKSLEEKIIIEPDERPYIIERELKAEPVPFKVIVTYDVEPPSKFAPYKITLSQLQREFKPDKEIMPGQYLFKIHQPGYQASEPKTITVYPGDKPFILHEKLIAKSRSIAKFAQDRGTGKRANIDGLLVDGKPFSFQDTLTPGTSALVEVSFKDYETVKQEVDVLPGEGPLTITTSLNPITTYYFNVNEDTKVLDGMWYPFQYFYDGIPIEPQHIERERSIERGRVLLTIRVPQEAEYLEIYAGYLFKRHPLAEVHKGLPRTWYIRLIPLIDHLEKIAEKYGKYKPCLDILGKLLKTMGNYPDYINSVELELLINTVKSWTFYYDSERKQQETIVESLQNLKTKVGGEVPTIKVMLKTPSLRKLIDRLGDKAIPALTASLSDEDPEIRLAAAEALFKVGKEATPSLIDALSDEKAAVAITAASALIKIGNDAIPLLISALPKGNPRMKINIVRILGEIGTADGAASISSLLEDPEPEVRDTAIESLVKIGGQAVSAILPLLKRDDLEVRLQAARTLRQIQANLAPDNPVCEEIKKALDTLPLLFDGLVDDDPKIQKTCIEKIKSSGEAGLKELANVLKDQNWRKRQIAARLIGELKVKDLLSDLLSAINDKDLDVRVEVINALGEIHDPSSVTVLINVMRSEKGRLCKASAESLRKLGKPSVDPLISLLTDNDTGLRRLAYKTLLSIKETLPDSDPVVSQLNNTLDTIPLLLDSLLDKEEKKEDIKKITSRLCTKGEELIPYAESILKDSNDPRRIYMINILGDIKNPNVFPILLNSAKDSSPEIRTETALAVVKIPSKESISLLLNLLQDSDPKVQNASAQSLVQIGEEAILVLVPDCLSGDKSRELITQIIVKIGVKAVPALIKSINHIDPNVRWRSAFILGNIDSPEVIPPLKNALNDPLYFVREVAAIGLGKRLKDGSPDIDSLIQILSDQYSDIQIAAASSLGKIASPLSIKSLVNACDTSDLSLRREIAVALSENSCHEKDALIKLSSDPEPYIREPAVIGLGKLADRNLIPLLSDILNKDKSNAVRKASVWALGETGSEEAIAPLMNLLREWDTGVREEGISSLVKIGKSAVPYLINALKNEDNLVRKSATITLGKLEANEAIPVLLKEVLDIDPGVVQTSVDALVRIGKDSGPALIKVLEEDSPLYSKTLAVKALGDIGLPDYIPHLQNALKSKHWEVREAAANALGKIGSTKAISALLNARKDSDADVRKAASSALSKIGAVEQESLLGGDAWQKDRAWVGEVLTNINTPDAIPILINALEHPNWFIRWWAVKRLGEINSPSAIPNIMKLLGDSNSYVQKAAMKALTNLGEQSVPALIQGVKHENWRVREKSVLTLGEIGSANAIPVLREALGDPDSDVQKAAIWAINKIQK